MYSRQVHTYVMHIQYTMILAVDFRVLIRVPFSHRWGALQRPSTQRRRGKENLGTVEPAPRLDPAISVKDTSIVIGSVRTVAMAYLRGDLDHRRPDPGRGYNARSAVLDAPNLLADSASLEELLAPFGELPEPIAGREGGRKGYE